ncbi:hypothetical protein [Phyllobacterium zundukense]|uniref:Uncharacterized protein n=1 Tax=Phyllobacterium zundukense TaxID=1867719 RepID=A0ACD4CVX6_9HYPH|nr:hypothetical protein [Phyllobacterium zundukense]UXN57747.1 hypothetical protein N8E88_02755 [Phyllobacterium zundukense]
MGTEEAITGEYCLSVRPGIPSGAGKTISVYAPPLASLPSGSRLIMATLPVLDWNELLQAALLDVQVPEAGASYAAVLMIDPFACWSDIAELLRKGGISRVTNFPPASFCQGASGQNETFGRVEIECLEWFQNEGFEVLYNAADVGQLPQGLSSNAVQLSPELMNSTIEDEMKFVIVDGVVSLPG